MTEALRKCIAAIKTADDARQTEETQRRAEYEARVKRCETWLEEWLPGKLEEAVRANVTTVSLGGSIFDPTIISLAASRLGILVDADSTSVVPFVVVEKIRKIGAEEELRRVIRGGPEDR